jgi:hypothetical protein
MTLGSIGALLAGAATSRMGLLRNQAAAVQDSVANRERALATLQLHGGLVTAAMQSVATDLYSEQEMTATGYTVLVNLLVQTPQEPSDPNGGEEEVRGSGGAVGAGSVPTRRGSSGRGSPGRGSPGRGSPGRGSGVRPGGFGASSTTGYQSQYTAEDWLEYPLESTKEGDVFARDKLASTFESSVVGAADGVVSKYVPVNSSPGLSLGCGRGEWSEGVSITLRDTTTNTNSTGNLRCRLDGVFPEAGSPILRNVQLSAAFGPITQWATIPVEAAVIPAIFAFGNGADPRATLNSCGGQNYCVQSSAPPEVPQTPEMRVYGPGERLYLNAESTYDFGVVPYGSIPDQVTFFVKNRGTQHLLFSSSTSTPRVRLTSGFTLVSDIPNSDLVVLASGQRGLAPGRTTRFVIAMNTDTGNNGQDCVGRLRVVSLNSTYSIALTGKVSDDRAALADGGATITNPFGSDLTIPPGSEQIAAKLYNGNLIRALNPALTHNNLFSHFSRVEPFFQGYAGYSFEVPGILFFSDFTVSVRDFSQGFGSPPLTWTRSDGTSAILDEWFALRAFSHLKLGNSVRTVGSSPLPEQPGHYQLAIASDDGARLTVGQPDNTVIASTGPHAMTFHCASEPVYLGDEDTLLPFELSYFQGQRVQLGLIMFWRRIDDALPHNTARLADPNFAWAEADDPEVVPAGARDPARDYCGQGWYEETPRDAVCMASQSQLDSNSGCELRRAGWLPLDPDNFRLIPPVTSPYLCTNAF